LAIEHCEFFRHIRRVQAELASALGVGGGHVGE
jgi:hypothetical protein